MAVVIDANQLIGNSICILIVRLYIDGRLEKYAKPGKRLSDIKRR
jgi:hypothetical protein